MSPINKSINKQSCGLSTQRNITQQEKGTNDFNMYNWMHLYSTLSKRGQMPESVPYHCKKL